MGQPVKSFVDINKYFSKELSYIFEYVNKELRKYYSFNEITPEIFIIAALEKSESMLYKTVNAYLNSENIDEIHDKLIELEKTKIVNNLRNQIEISSKLRLYLSQAIDEMKKTGSLLINSDHVLLSILKEKNDISKLFTDKALSYNIALENAKNVHDVFEEIAANEKISANDIEPDDDDDEPENPKILKKAIFINDPEDLNKNLSELLGIDSINGRIHKNDSNKKNDSKIQFCTNLNKLAEEKKLDKLIGREREINEIFRVLSRRRTNNVILVGENGCGKTQIVNGFVNLLANNEAPIMFRGKQVWKFNPSEMIAGTTLRGMFEERMVNMIKTLRNHKNAILFIDDIHTIFSEKSKGDYDTGGVISEIFSDGDVQVIAATTFKGYKAICDANPDIAKKLQKITVDNTTVQNTFDILNGIKGYYEDYHKVIYSDEVIKECIELSKRYITEKSLPSSAIDVLDELGSYKKLNTDVVSEILKYDKENAEINDKIDDLIKEDNIEEVKKLNDKRDENRNELAQLENVYHSDKKYEITLDDLYVTISNHTNIPIGKLKTTDKSVLKNINNTLKSVVVGQDEAIDVVSRAIKRNKVGLSKSNKPQFSGLFVGTTGCGKTLLAKTLAKEIYGDEKYLVRFDMSEYADKTSVNKLIGSAAGYVGYSEGGLLTEAVKNNKYCVLLIDEIEKANEDIFNLLLQVLDEGFLTDNTGMKVDFKNTMIIMTSNVGTKRANQTRAFGFDGDDSVNKRSIIEKEMKDKFPPEFINRIDEIVYFNTLGDNNLRDIIKLELNKLNDRLVKINFAINYSDDVVEHLLKSIEKEREYGARPIIRVIQNDIENRITDLIIDNDYSEHTFNINVSENKLIID